MDAAWIVALVVILFSVFAWVIVLAAKKENERRLQIQALAARLGCTYTYRRDGEPLLQQRPDAFPLFSQGHTRRQRNVIQGERQGTAMTITEYEYTTGHGRHRHTRRQTVLIFESSGLDLPAFTLRPERFGHRLAAHFGYQDIDLEGQPLFSGSYLLQGEDEAAIRACFDGSVTDYFATHTGLNIEGRQGGLVVYRTGSRLGPAAIEAFLDQGLEIVARFAAGADHAQSELAGDSFMDEALAALQDLNAEG